MQSAQTWQMETAHLRVITSYTRTLSYDETLSVHRPYVLCPQRSGARSRDHQRGTSLAAANVVDDAAHKDHCDRCRDPTRSHCSSVRPVTGLLAPKLHQSGRAHAH